MQHATVGNRLAAAVTSGRSTDVRSVDAVAIAGSRKPPTEREPPTEQDLFAEHGAALYSLATVILADRVEAEGVVTALLIDACGRPLAAGAREQRRLLSRRLYLSCTRARLGPRPPLATPAIERSAGERSANQRPANQADDVLVRLAALSIQQRAAIALCLYGEHGYHDIADLMSLPEPVVLRLLRSALDEFWS